MFAMFSRILKLSGRYKGRIQGAFVCAFLESILSKIPSRMPIRFWSLTTARLHSRARTKNF